MLLRRIARLLAGPVLLAALAGPAAAHAVVMVSEPVAGAALDAPPAEVTLRFNARVDSARSRLTLFGPGNAQVPLTLAEEASPAMLRAAVPATLAPGIWRLRWQVLALDGHITRGDVPFTVRGR